MTGAGPAPQRLDSLDQLRGLTVVAMILVNFSGGMDAVPATLKHHNTHCSVADTVMPLFLFAVGFAYRLTWLRRAATVGPPAARRAVIRRCAGLLVIGVVLYHLDGRYRRWDDLRATGVLGVLQTAFQRSVFQTLVHIALASLWTLPVIGANGRTRLIFALGSAGLHLALSHAFYFRWAWDRPVIDGGPLGFLAWSIPLLAGTWAFDVVGRTPAAGWAVVRLLAGAVVLMAIGQGLARLDPSSAAWPFVPPSGPIGPWAMSQRAATVSYLTFAAGLALGVDALCVLACDRGRVTSGLFRLFGQNALAAYVLHGLVEDAVRPFVPADAPGWYVALGFAAALGVNVVLLRGLERSGVRLRL